MIKLNMFSFIHIKNLKQALHHGLVLKKIRKVTEFNKNTCLRPYVDKSTDLRNKKAKDNFENIFLS